MSTVWMLGAGEVWEGQGEKKGKIEKGGMEETEGWLL